MTTILKSIYKSLCHLSNEHKYDGRKLFTQIHMYVFILKCKNVTMFLFPVATTPDQIYILLRNYHV